MTRDLASKYSEVISRTIELWRFITVLSTEMQLSELNYCGFIWTQTTCSIKLKLSLEVLTLRIDIYIMINIMNLSIWHPQLSLSTLLINCCSRGGTESRKKKGLLNNLVRVPDMVLNLSINKLRITHQNHQRTYGSLKGLMNQTTHTIHAYANLLSSKKMPWVDFTFP